MGRYGLSADWTKASLTTGIGPHQSTQNLSNSLKLKIGLPAGSWAVKSKPRQGGRHDAWERQGRRRDQFTDEREGANEKPRRNACNASHAHKRPVISKKRVWSDGERNLVFLSLFSCSTNWNGRRAKTNRNNEQPNWLAMWHEKAACPISCRWPEKDGLASLVGCLLYLQERERVPSATALAKDSHCSSFSRQSAKQAAAD